MPLSQVAAVILKGMIKQINDEAELSHKMMAYTIIGQLGHRIPSLVNKDLSILQKFFDSLATVCNDIIINANT